MHSDLKVLDPIWTPATITRLHAYMIYDTLLAMDERREIKPQTVERYVVSTDKLTYTFTLRDGLVWHDGEPVTPQDCVASLRRWSARDVTGLFRRDRRISNRRQQDVLAQAQGTNQPRALGAR